MRTLKFITGHVVYNLAYKFQQKRQKWCSKHVTVFFLYWMCMMCFNEPENCMKTGVSSSTHLFAHLSSPAPTNISATSLLNNYCTPSGVPSWSGQQRESVSRMSRETINQLYTHTYGLSTCHFPHFTISSQPAQTRRWGVDINLAL